MKPETIRTLKENENNFRFLLDSGAFTAWKLKKQIDLDEYCKFIENLPFKPWRYFTLDVIGDPHGTMKNYETMLKRGFNPIPIFTRGEDPSVLEDYYKTSDVVGIGGLVGTEGNKGFVKGIMNVVKDRKCHWLGFTNQSFIAYFKPYSCDSSTTWGATRFASVALYLGQGNWVNVRKDTFKKRPSEEILTHITRAGIDYKKFLNDEGWVNHGSLTDPHVRLSCYSFLRWQKDIQTKFDTLYFIACTATWEMGCLVGMAKYLRGER